MTLKSYSVIFMLTFVFAQIPSVRIRETTAKELERTFRKLKQPSNRKERRHGVTDPIESHTKYSNDNRRNYYNK